MLTYTTYQNDYLTAIVSLWNDCLPQDRISESIFNERVIRDENFDPALSACAFDRDTLIGFSYAIKRKTPYYGTEIDNQTAWLCILFVKQEYRQKGVGRALYSMLEENLIQSDVKRIVLGAYSPYYFVPGIDESNSAAISFFDSAGYQRNEKSYSMSRNLHGYRMPEDICAKYDRAVKEGFAFTRYQEQYRSRLCAFLKRGFSPGWQNSVNVLVQEKKAEHQLYLCISPQDEVIGFCMRGMNNNPNRFGPFGIDERYRNHSLGSILFSYAMSDFICQEIYFIFFQSTDDAGRRFYERHGLKVYRTFFHADKTL